MGLSQYKKKRDFKHSPEPQGGKAKSGELRFVIQKHAASHLHYDFRLEMEGVLKSWAVPKGPSTDPAVKRLAMMVEDHPYDYRNFEGIIPSGYGAGTVMVWDEGTYTSVEDLVGKNAHDKSLRQQLHQGKIHFRLNGTKLKGEYALIKAKGRGENGWLLFKIKDEFASKSDITKKNRSVVTERTLEEIAEEKDNIWQSGRAREQEKKKKEAVKKPSQKKSSAKVPVKKTTKKKLLPAGLKPMLATLVDEAFDKPGWICEVKWDGYRALALVDGSKVELKSRNDKSFTDKFYPVAEALARWQMRAVLDGEIVVVNKQGISDFGALQNWRSEADGDLLYYVFDLLWLDGEDLTQLPLEERRSKLKDLVPADGIIKMSETFGASPTEFFRVAENMGLEGIIAKKADSLYYPGQRTREWLKIKANKRQEVVIGGYTINDDTSKPFSALLAGVFDNDRFIYTGKIGTGFDTKTQKDLLKQFKKYETKKIPFEETPDINKPSRFRPNPPHATAVWLKPKLVCEVAYTELTTDGIMRHPSFKGMRSDKNAEDVILEKEKKVSQVISGKTKKVSLAKAPGGTKTLLNPTEETQVKKIKGHEIKFTNLSKLLWPEDGVSKRDMLNYYYQAAPFILPYLKNRPQSMNRHPNGIHGKSFYQKNVRGKAPDWLETMLYHSSDSPDDKYFLVCTDEASLMYMASLACIEMNPWHSTVDKQDYPDWCIIDLDPAETTFDQVVEAANVTSEILDELGVPCYPKTSGSTGIHVYIPMGAMYTYEQSKEFARIIATMVHERIPTFTSIERMVRNRKGKMYIDFLQNRPQATIAAPYSLRPKPGATVSMPLHWDEVKKGLKMRDFTIHNAIARMKAEGDLFKPVLGKGINLAKVLRNQG